MFSTAAHVTPFFLMEIIVQQSIVYVMIVYTQDDYARALFVMELITLKRDIMHTSD